MSNEELVAVIQAGATERMGELWEQVAGLVKWKANHIMTALELRGNSCGVEFEDLYQSGYIAMVEAVNYYNPESGVAFSTCLINRLKTVFAEATGYRTQRGRNEPLNTAFSLDKPLTDESDSSLFGDFVPDNRATATMEAIEEREYQRQLREVVAAVLADLPEQFREVIQQRIFEEMTLAQVAEIQGTTPERIRQKENKAIRELRKPRNACRLRSFYDFNSYFGTSLRAFQHSGMSVQERYLIIEEEIQEREKYRCRENRRQKQRSQHEVEDTIERINQEAHERVSRMTPEEKRALLEKYGYA